MSFSNYLENAVLDHCFKGSTLTQPANLYVSLHSADPGETGANELSGNGYARKINNSWNAASGGAKTNSAAITFDAASGNWSQATHFCVWDALSGGNCLGSGSLTTPKTVQTGDVAEFASGQLTISLD